MSGSLFVCEVVSSSDSWLPLRGATTSPGCSVHSYFPSVVSFLSLSEYLYFVAFIPRSIKPDSSSGKVLLSETHRQEPQTQRFCAGCFRLGGDSLIPRCSQCSIFTSCDCTKVPVLNRFAYIWDGSDSCWWCHVDNSCTIT